MVGGGSYKYSYQSNGMPGDGTLLHNGPGEDGIKEPSPEIREAAMGFPIGSTAAHGATDQLRNMILGGGVDANIGQWIFGALTRLRIDVDNGCASHMTSVEEDFMWTDPLAPPITVKGLMKEAIAHGGVQIQVDSAS